MDNEVGRIWVERVPGLYQQSNPVTYSFVRSVNEPQNLQMELSSDLLLLSWDPVVQTPSGANIEVDYYTVEYAADPASAFSVLEQTESTMLSIPLATLSGTGFFRIKGHKIIP